MQGLAKSLLLASGFCLAQAAAAQNTPQKPAQPPGSECLSSTKTPQQWEEQIEDFGYKMVEVPSDRIEDVMPIATAASGIPASMQGIWWMDGNPNGLLVSLGSASWDPVTRTALLQMYGPGSYSFRPEADARCEYASMLQNQMAYRIRFNAEFNAAVLISESNERDGYGNAVNTDGRFTMDLVGDGHWVRHTWYYGIPVPDYQLRRIVRADGTRDEAAYAGYLRLAAPTSLLALKIQN